MIGLMLLLSLGLSAQSRQGRTNTNTASAVLHIHVNLVPTVLTPRPESQPVERNTISYLIPMVTVQNQAIVTEAALTSAQAVPCAGSTCNAVLRTTTIVTH